jgi:hypothetical protein
LFENTVQRARSEVISRMPGNSDPAGFFMDVYTGDDFL